MSREKKSQVDDILKLRRILDNSSDPSLKYLISKDDYALESVRRRLSGDFFETQPHTKHFFTSSESMEPRVSIHTKTPISPRLVTPTPKLEPSMPLPEFELVSHSTAPPPIPSSKITFDDEELFEVETINRSIPEFLEVTPKEIEQEPTENDLTVHPEEKSLSESNLPEWQPVEEEQATETTEPPETTMIAEAPEFERVNIIPSFEEQIEQPVEFTPAEHGEASVQKLSKKQERAAKKAQRKKEKEIIKLKKIEQKHLKKEKQEKEQDAKRLAEEPHLLEQSEEEEPIDAEFLEEVEIPEIRVDYNNFKGIKCIDEKTAELLYKNGYFSIENIKETSIDDLAQIHGIKRKLAKQIKIEIEQYVAEIDTSEFIPVKQKITKKKDRKKRTDSAEWESSPPKAKTQKSSPDVCTYKDYTLYKQETRKPAGKKSITHYFAKSKTGKGAPSPLPEGYRIALNKKTGVPYLKKKR